MDHHRLPGSCVHGILQARILEWVTILFSRGSSRPRDRTWVSCIAGIFFTIWATREAHNWQTALYKVKVYSTMTWLTYVCVQSHFSCVQLFVTLWTISCQASMSVGFSRQEYWSRLLYPPPGDLPNPGIEPVSLMSTCIGRQVLYH